MSHKATYWAMKQRGISHAAKLVLLHLADCHNLNHGCFPHINTLADRYEMSRSTILRVLNELEGKIMVVRVKRMHGVTQRQLTNKYILGCDAEFAGMAIGTTIHVWDDEDLDQGRVSDCDSALVIEQIAVRLPNASQVSAHAAPVPEDASFDESGTDRDDEAPAELCGKSRVSNDDATRKSRVFK